VAISASELAALRAELAELKVRAEITNLTSIVSEADLKGDIVKINDKYVEVSKYASDELIGRPHSITRHPDMPKETFKAAQGLYASAGFTYCRAFGDYRDDDPHSVFMTLRL